MTVGNKIEKEPLLQRCVSNQESSSCTPADYIASSLLASFLIYKANSDAIIWRKQEQICLPDSGISGQQHCVQLTAKFWSSLGFSSNADGKSSQAAAGCESSTNVVLCCSDAVRPSTSFTSDWLKSNREEKSARIYRVYGNILARWWTRTKIREKYPKKNHKISKDLKKSTLS